MMARKTDHLKQHQFKPGQSGNPLGGSIVPPEVAKARKLNANDVTILITRLFRMSLVELQEMMNDPKATTMELIVGKIVAQAIKHGDYSRVNALWDRSIGKVTDKIHHSVSKPTIMRLLDKDTGQPSGESLVFGRIAEIGSNWKNWNDCVTSVRDAKKAGADVVKFQYFDEADLYGSYQSDKIINCQPHPPGLIQIAEETGIEFMCTAFSVEGYDYVNRTVARHKIASAEITAIDILEKVNSFKKPVLLSTGGATFDQIELALHKLKDCFVTLMYCVTDYPARVVDFRHLELMKEHFGNKYAYGYSDHSTDILNIPRLAEVYGSVVLEKHVNFTDHNDTPDAPHSLSGAEFAMMMKHIKGDLSPKESFRPCPWQRVRTDHGYYRPR
jgi:N,N'-diacetyllegionaminate synthase